MCTAMRSLRSCARVIAARHAGSGILRPVPRLSSTRILRMSGLPSATLSVMARASSAVAPLMTAPATKIRA